MIAFTTFVMAVFSGLRGAKWLQSMVILNIILVISFAEKQINLFGYFTNVTNINYAAAFFCLSALAYNGKRKEVVNTIAITMYCLVAYIIFEALIVQLPVVDGEFYAALIRLHSRSASIAVASFIAFTISTVALVFITDKLGGEPLWRKNIITKVSCQFIDSLIFFPFAFSGVMEPSHIIEMMIVGFLFKSFIGIMDTPLNYIIKL